MVQKESNSNNIIKKQIISSVSDIKKEPKLKSELESQCLFGEIVEIIKVKKDWVFVKSELDNYKGWVKSNTIGARIKSTHKIGNVVSNIYLEPSIKAPLVTSLYMNSQVSINKKIDHDWYQIWFKNKLGFIDSGSILSNNVYFKDWVKVAVMYLNTPYLWGGKTYSGLDCSGLVQICLQGSGLSFPRNTSDQIKFNTKNVFKHEKLEKGCLVFWDGHVGIMLNENNILHSNAYHLGVKIEKLTKASKRIGEIKAIKKVYLYN